jgi:hypothetical protein
LTKSVYVVKRTEQKTTIIERFINILIMTNDFKVSAPSLLGASFSVMTSADSEPIVCKVDERGHWSFTVPKDMPARILDKVQDVCEMQFAPQVWGNIFGNPEAIRFFDEAQSLHIPPKNDDDIEDFCQHIGGDVFRKILDYVDEEDLFLFKDYFAEEKHTFESMNLAMSKLIFYKQFKNKEE